MKNLANGFLVLASAIWLTATAYGHDDWQNRQDVTYAAHSLAQESEHFASVVWNVTGYSHLTQDASSLASDAHHFHDAVEGGASYQHMLRDYYRLQSSYQHLNQAFYTAHNIYHNMHVHQDWHGLEYAAQDLDWAMRAGNGPQ